MENDIILAKLKLLSVSQQKHLLSLLKNQNEHKKAISYVRDYNLALISPMLVKIS
jgi:hypothetical protein